MLIVPLVVVIVAAAAVVPGCGGGGAPDVWVEGLFRIWAPQLFPTFPKVEQVSAQQTEDPGEPIALTDAFVEFRDNGTCSFSGDVADQSDTADVQTADWWWGFDMEGTWWQEDNIVYAQFSGVGDAQAPAQYPSNDYAEMTLEFKSDEEADGTLLLQLGGFGDLNAAQTWWGGTWEGPLAIEEGVNFN
jgi:hypothetical protein